MSTAFQSVHELPVLTDREFTDFQQLIHREAGIWLAPTKRALLVGRLSRRLRELELGSYGDYHRLATEDAAEMVRLLDAIATNETHFFRERGQFDLLAERLCPEWEQEAANGKRQRRLRVWSAACSSGEEPYSIAMLLHDRLAGQGWSLEIQASDISTKVLSRAHAGVYRLDKLGGIPAPYLRRYMLKGVGPEEGRACVAPVLRELVRFARLNLHEKAYPVSGPFDAIFCRNVLIYFDPPSRQEVLGRLLGLLRPGGYLFLGHAESLLGMSERARSVMPAVYRLNEAGS